MNLIQTPWRTALVGLVAVAALAAVGSWRRRPEQGCALDGSRIDAAYRVEVIGRDGSRHQFCCLACAELWVRRQSQPPRSIQVTDEASGELIDAGEALYVRSTVVTTPITQNRIHAFRRLDDAQKHIDTFGGVILTESESPFHQ